jgi:hypothetical protein
VKTVTILGGKLATTVERKERHLTHRFEIYPSSASFPFN